jgi:hypothetical protein
MRATKQQTILTIAIAGILASGSASATLPSVAPSAVIYAGGASSEAGSIVVATCRLLQNVDSYTDAAAGADSGSYRVLYGDLISATGGLAAGAHVLVVYKFNGGSYTNGAVPQTVAGGALNYPQQSAILASSDALVAGAVQGNACSNGKPTYSYSDGPLNNAEQPDWGLTDLEVSIFQGAINNPNYPAATVTVGASDLLYDVVFGVAVTNALYQLKTNFSTAEVAGILDGYYTDWSQLYADSGNPLPAGGIILIDRNIGSGVKAAGNQFFLGFPGLGANATSPESTVYGYTGALTLTQTLQDVSDTTTGAQATDLKNANAGGLLAISILSMDTPPASNQAVAGTNSYDFVKIDGEAVDTGASGDNINGSVKTSYVNAVLGNYGFFYQPNFNYRPSFYGNGSNNAALAKAFLTTFQSSTFPGASSCLAFPAAAPGTLVDSDRNSTLGKGVTLDSRNGSSPRNLTPVLGASGALPTGCDPL